MKWEVGGLRSRDAIVATRRGEVGRMRCGARWEVESGRSVGVRWAGLEANGLGHTSPGQAAKRERGCAALGKRPTPHRRLKACCIGFER